MDEESEPKGKRSRILTAEERETLKNKAMLGATVGRILQTQQVALKYLSTESGIGSEEFNLAAIRNLGGQSDLLLDLLNKGAEAVPKGVAVMV